MSDNNDDSFTSQPNPEEARSDLMAAVDELVNSLSNKFASMSSELFAKMDEMMRRLDNLEAKMLAGEMKNGKNNANVPANAGPSAP